MVSARSSGQLRQVVFIHRADPQCLHRVRSTPIVTPILVLRPVFRCPGPAVFSPSVDGNRAMPAKGRLFPGHGVQSPAAGRSLPGTPPGPCPSGPRTFASRSLAGRRPGSSVRQEVVGDLKARPRSRVMFAQRLVPASGVADDGAHQAKVNRAPVRLQPGHHRAGRPGPPVLLIDVRRPCRGRRRTNDPDRDVRTAGLAWVSHARTSSKRHRRRRGSRWPRRTRGAPSAAAAQVVVVHGRQVVVDQGIAVPFPVRRPRAGRGLGDEQSGAWIRKRDAAAAASNAA